MKSVKKEGAEGTQYTSGAKFSFQTMRSPLSRTRLGEMLVDDGSITVEQLKAALSEQHNERRPLGRILVEQDLISKPGLISVLARQFTMRAVAFFVLGVIACLGISHKAWAGTIQDVPAKISVSFNQNAYGPLASYPKLFDTNEKRSGNLQPFTKWTGMFARFDRELSSGRSSDLVEEWRSRLKRYEGMELKAMADKINDLVNESNYILDNKNWGKSDYWATPVEFLRRGGDCEDFAIAKYTALRALGVSEDRLRVMIVHDTVKNIPHAILVVYTDQGPYALDNQSTNLIDADRAGRYRPIFSINRYAWWLHTAPDEGTIVASAR